MPCLCKIDDFPLRFTCPFDSVKNYPFGRQSCSLMFYLLGADNGLTNLGKSRQIGLFIFLVAFFWNSTQEILEVGAWSLKVNQKNCFQLLGYCYHDDTIIDNSDKLRQYIVLYIHNILKYIFLSVASKFVNKGPSEFDQYIMESWAMTSDMRLCWPPRCFILFKC